MKPSPYHILAMVAPLLALACGPSLAGSWEGEVDCGDVSMPVEVELESDGGVYVGEGSWDCTELHGTDCEQTFDVEVSIEERDGDVTLLDVDNDDCVEVVNGTPSPADCTDPDDVEWDRQDTIEGEWSVCDFELERG